ncbi:MAG: hypothetical protein KY445_03495 [Armatimonadetes bacterium]|nr:hypothetical protein [Armatimonadota bacterium]
MRWNRKTILDEIRELHRSGEELNYASAEENHLNLVRAAAWHHGTWKNAVEQAGLNYETVSKYRRWTRERVIQTIRDHYKAGRDLSWRAISVSVDPPLAAAALRPNIGFATWPEAVTAAGINHDEVARYRHWTPERVVAEIQQLAQQGAPLSSKLLQSNNQSLYCAAKRRFESWDAALAAAGLDPDEVRLRRAPRAPKPRRRESGGQLRLEHLAVSPSASKRNVRAESGRPATTKTVEKVDSPSKSSKKSSKKSVKTGRKSKK